MQSHNNTGFDPCAPSNGAFFAEPAYCCKYFRGATGAMGLVGPTGPEGLMGPPGPQGPTGAPGPQGLQGLPGEHAAIEILRTITGEPGSEATVLNAGCDTHAQLTFVIPCGEQGKHGERGPAGPAGPKGDAGAPGAQGQPGRMGPQGLQGLPGLAGARGAAGTKGDTGATGAQGPQGASGHPGERGPAGLQGIPGMRGATGPTGMQGPQGLQGYPGLQGENGPAGVPGAQGPQGHPGPKGDKGERGVPGAAGAQGPQGIPGPAGAMGMQGKAGAIRNVAVHTCAPDERAYCYNEGTPESADLVLMIPRGETGAAGPAGPACKNATVYGGLFNTDEGEFDVKPDEIVAMTFSDFLPAAGMWYDDHHSIVLGEPGVYEIQYGLHAQSARCGKLHMAVTSDGVVIPSSRACGNVTAGNDVHLHGMAVTEAKAGAHLHCIVHAKEHGRIQLHEGANLTMQVRKLG